MRIAVLLVPIAALVPSQAQAQSVDKRYADEPTGGVALPLAPLAGEPDARTVAVNPAGMSFLRGPEAALALDLEDSDIATSGGPGFGAYVASPFGGEIMPRFALGIGLEWLRPPRRELAPDPASPFRLTTSLAVGPLGVAWHHFIDSGPLGGHDTFDLGFSGRWGNHLAVGAALRDVASADVDGSPIQRRYELETLVRPLATDTLEVALGGRVGETRGDIDYWARASVRAARGLYVSAGFENRELYALADSPTGVREQHGRETRAMLGLDISFGAYGVGIYGTGVRDVNADNHALGSTLVLRTQSIGPASILGAPDRIERVELSGDIGTRKLTDLVVRLRSLARDPHAKALLLVFDGADGGWATLQELRNEVLRVRKAGKKVFAYMVSGTGRDYYIASAADKIYIDPAGGLRLVGIAGTSIYFGGAFDQIGVLPQFEKIAEYKSAPEQFTSTHASPAAQHMYDAIYDSLWEEWSSAIAEGRKLTRAEVKTLVDNGPYTAGDLAKDTKLVDAVAPPDRVSQLIVAELGHVYGVSTADVTRPERWERKGIAIIYVDGDITDGKSQSIPLLGRTFAGGETTVDAITAARNNPDVDAIVLRINSPGGSALASELVSREIFATRGVKPVICSMSDLAASGGYFVAAGCDVIYAEPMTITGSIGIFYGKFDVSGLLAKLGVTTETRTRGAHADAESYFRPYTDEERTLLLEKLRYMYGRFVGAVAEGRKLTKDQVDDVGRGHVWTGVQAQPIRLVDKMGGLGDALDDAKHRIGLTTEDRVTVYELPKEPHSLFGFIGDLLGVHAKMPSVLDLPAIQSLLRAVPTSVLVSPDGAQARLPNDLIFE